MIARVSISGPRPAAASFIRTVMLAAAAAALAACVSVDRADQPGAELAIVGADVIPMSDARTALRDRTVLVGGGRIVAIGPRGQVPIPAGAGRIDARGKYLIPGLADMHVHLEHLDDPDILKLFVANGVTTVRNMDGRPYILEWRRLVAEGALVGPRIITAGPLLDGDPPLRKENLAVPDAVAAKAAVRAQDRLGYDFVKTYTNLSPEAFRAAIEAARELRLQVAGHVPRRVELEEAIGALDSIEHLSDYGDALDSRPAEEARRWHWSKLLLAQPIDGKKVDALARSLERSGTWTVPTLIEAERRVGTAEQIESWRGLPEMQSVPGDALAFWLKQVRENSARLDGNDWLLVDRGRRNRLAVASALNRAGAKLLAGSDTPNPFLVPGASLHDELRLLVQAGLTPGEALLAATRSPAEFLGARQEWGTIEEGLRADLVLLDADPLLDIANSQRIAGVLLGGRWFAASDLHRMKGALRE